MTMPHESSGWKVAGVCILLGAVVWLAFRQTLGFAFVNYDDGAAVFNVPEIAQGLSLPGVRWAFSHVILGHWDPLTTLSHMLDCQLYGLQPWGHHLSNVILHGLAAILLFLALWRMTGALWRSALVAALFAVHPLRVESVSWVTERKDVLSGVFFMLTLCAYASYARDRTRLRYLAVLLPFVLGLLSKSIVVTLPLVLLLLDGWPLGRCTFGRRGVPWRLIAEKLPLLALSAFFSAVQMRAAREMIAPLEALPLSLRIENALVSYVEYIGKMFWPGELTVYYPHPGESLPLWQAGLALLLIAGLTAGAFLGRRQRPYLITGWLWFLGMLVPVIGLVQSSDIARADRYTYLPQIGLSLALTWLAADLLPPWRFRAPMLAAGSAGLVAVLVWWSAVQALFWRDTETLWRHALACTARNHLAENNLGLILLERGEILPAMALLESSLRHQPRFPLAEVNLGNAFAKLGRLDDSLLHYRKALALNPKSPEAHSNRGSVLLRLGRIDEALAECRRALELKPSFRDGLINLGNVLLAKGSTGEAVERYRAALALDPDVAEAHSDLGQALLLRGQTDEAWLHLRAAVRLNPRLPEARLNLAEALLDAGKTPEATAELRHALTLAPESERAWNDLGLVAVTEGRPEEAAEAFRKAIGGNPSFAPAEGNLAGALLQMHRTAEAVPHFRRALDLQPGNATVRNNLAWILATSPEGGLRDGAGAVALAMPFAQAGSAELKTLAAAYAEAGRLPEAIATTRQALVMATAQQAGSLRAMLALFEAGEPCRDASLGPSSSDAGARN